MLAKMFAQFSAKIRGIFVDFYMNICEEKTSALRTAKRPFLSTLRFVSEQGRGEYETSCAINTRISGVNSTTFLDYASSISRSATLNLTGERKSHSFFHDTLPPITVHIS